MTKKLHADYMQAKYGNSILLFPSGNSERFQCEADILEAWNNNVDFRTPREKYGYMRKSDFEQYGNKMDGIVYIYGNLNVTIRNPIV